MKRASSLLPGRPGRHTTAVIETGEIGADDLGRLVALRNTVWPHDPETPADYVDWRNQAADMVWLVAAERGEDVGAAIGIHGWHSPPGVGRAGVWVAGDRRDRGVGSALLDRIGAWLAERGCAEATALVAEDDAGSIGWAARRGFTEVGRNSTLVLDLAGVETPEVAAPAGVRVVSWAGRADLARGMYEVYLEASPDIPGEDEAELAVFELWLRNDMQGAGDRPEATFVALADDDTVVGYAKLSISSGATDVAWHDLTGVRRSWRGRGVAGALKRAEIAWAKQNGFRRLQTANEERNEPVRRLNERHGYRLEPGFVTVRGSI